MELSPVQRRIRDFYFKEGLTAPPEATHVYRAGLVPDQRLFTLEHLRRHLNNPLLDLNYLNMFQGGKPVDLSNAGIYKVVQKRRIEFADRRVLQELLEKGAACVLEGVDILEPDVNTLAASLDRANAATFCNATIFFSQHGNEAYRGHIDTDNVLVIHLAGEKRWRLYRRQAPRRVNLSDLDDTALGPEVTEVVMRPGDVLFLRSFTPHKVETRSPYSLHMSFDLCDRQPSVELALQLLLRHYDQDSSPRPGTPGGELEKLFSLSRAGAYEADLARLAASEKAGQVEFRQMLDGNRVTFLDRLIQNESAPSASEFRPLNEPQVGSVRR